MEKLNIMIADDHALVRHSLETIIKESGEFNTTALCKNGRELIQALEAGIPADIVILDLSMPVMDGYDTAEHLRKNYPEIKVIILSVYDGDATLMRLLRLGVRSVLKKDEELHVIRDVLHTVANGGYFYSSIHSGKIASHFSDTNNTLDNASFNEKEIKFLKLSATDLVYKSIYHELHMSETEGNALRQRLFDKIGVSSRVELAIYAFRNGFVGLSHSG